MVNPKVSRLSRSNYKQVADLISSYGKEMRGHSKKRISSRFVKQLLGDKRTIVSGVFVDRKCVGFAICFVLPEAVHQRICGQLDDLFVATEYRSLGLARLLIEDMINRGKSLGWSHLRWLVPKKNKAAIGLYDKIADQAPWLSYVVRIDPDSSL